MSNLQQAREAYRMALLDLAAKAGAAARLMEQGKPAPDPRTPNGLNAAGTQMLRAYTNLRNQERLANAHAARTGKV